AGRIQNHPALADFSLHNRGRTSQKTQEHLRRAICTQQGKLGYSCLRQWIAFVGRTQDVCERPFVDWCERLTASLGGAERRQKALVVGVVGGIHIFADRDEQPPSTLDKSGELAKRRRAHVA